MRYVSKVKWSNPGKGVAPSPTPQCSCNWKGSFLVTLDYGRQIYLHFNYCCGLLGARNKTWKKGKQVEQVYWINRIYIQSKSVSTTCRSVRLKTVKFDCWEEVGICRSFLQPDECSTRFLRWVQAQGRSPDTTGGSKNASGPVRIPLKRRLRRQAINLALIRRFRARRVGSLRLEDADQGEPRLTATETRTYPTRSVYRPKQPTEVGPSPAPPRVSKART